MYKVPRARLVSKRELRVQATIRKDLQEITVLRKTVDATIAVRVVIREADLRDKETVPVREEPRKLPIRLSDLLRHLLHRIM